MAVTLEEAKRARDAAFDAYQKALAKKSYDIGGKNGMRMETQDVDKLREEFLFWDAQVSRLERGGGLTIGSVICKK